MNFTVKRKVTDERTLEQILFEIDVLVSDFLLPRSFYTDYEWVMFTIAYVKLSAIANRLKCS